MTTCLSYACSLLTLILAGVCVPAAVAQRPRSSAEHVLPSPQDEYFHQDVSWSGDGKWLVYSELEGGSQYRPENWSIHIISADGTQHSQVLDNAYIASFSPDASRLVCGSQRDGNWELYVINRDGSHLQRLTQNPAKDYQPTWSPIGDSILFTSDRGENVDIYVTDLQGTAARRLTTDPAADNNPAFSPDGRHVVFYRERGDHKDQIYMIGVDGSGESCVTNGEYHNTFPSFVRDDQVMFTRQFGPDDVGIVRGPADGSHWTRIGQFNSFYARTSPDGKSIAFISGKWPKSAIYVCNAEGREIRKLVN